MRVNQGDGHRNRGKPRRNAEPIRWLLCRKADMLEGASRAAARMRGGYRPPQPQSVDPERDVAAALRARTPGRDRGKQSLCTLRDHCRQ